MLSMQDTSCTTLHRMWPNWYMVSVCRKSMPVADHPIVQEYLKIYDTMLHFKHALATFFMDKGTTVDLL